MLDTRRIPKEDLPLAMYMESKESWSKVYYKKLNELTCSLSYLERINRTHIENVSEPTWYSLNCIQETARYIYQYAEDLKYLNRIKPIYKENKNEG